MNIIENHQKPSLITLLNELLFKIKNYPNPHLQIKDIKYKDQNSIFEPVSFVNVIYPLVDLTSLALINSKMLMILSDTCLEYYQIKKEHITSASKRFVKRVDIHWTFA